MSCSAALAASSLSFKKQIVAGISLIRLLAALLMPLFYLCMEQGVWETFIFSLVFGAISLTDWLDGYLARKWHCETVMGAVLDTTADKVLGLAFLALLVYCDKVHIAVFLIFLTRDLLMDAIRMSALNQNIWIKSNLTGRIKVWFLQFSIGFLLWTGLPEPWGYWGAYALLGIALVLSVFSAFVYISDFLSQLSSSSVKKT